MTRKIIRVDSEGIRGIDPPKSNQNVLSTPFPTEIIKEICRQNLELETIGIIGINWRPAINYYSLLNKKVQEAYGGNTSSNIIMRSLNFDPIVEFMAKGEWDPIIYNITRHAKALKSAGAKSIVIIEATGANTMHKVADHVKKEIDIPLLHIPTPPDTAPMLPNAQATTETIGLIGGMSWVSTFEYYKLLNEGTRRELLGNASSEIIMRSVNFGPIVELLKKEEWDKIAVILAGHAKMLESLGARFIIIESNTMHKVADKVAAEISIPLLHIVDPTAAEIKKEGIENVGLLGTKPTMAGDFYKERLRRYSINPIIPDRKDIDTVDSIIFKELCNNEIKEHSREALKQIISRLNEKGAEGIILGCTELMLLVRQEDTKLPIFDTTELHANAAVKISVKKATIHSYESAAEK